MINLDKCVMKSREENRSLKIALCNTLEKMQFIPFSPARAEKVRKSFDKKRGEIKKVSAIFFENNFTVKHFCRKIFFEIF